MAEMMILNPRGKGKYTDAVRELRKIGIGADELIQMVESRKTELANSNQIQIRNIKPEGEAKFIKGLVMMHDAEIRPKNLNETTMIKANPLVNPLVPDNLFVSAIAGLANGSVLTYLTSLIENEVFVALTNKKVENANLWANGAGFASCTAMTAIEYALFGMIEDREEKENYRRLAVYSGIASMSIPFVNVIKIIYQKMTNTAASNTAASNTAASNTAASNTAASNTAASNITDMGGGLYYDASLQKYFEIKDGVKQYLNDYLTPQKRLALQKERMSQRSGLSGVPYATPSKKMPWQ